MEKYFNVTGYCSPNLHYMVDIEGKLTEIKKMISRNDYFIINRARQYGKTTTLKRLAKSLSNEYMVFLLSFEDITDETCENEEKFCHRFYDLIRKIIQYEKETPWALELLNGFAENRTLFQLSEFISELCHKADKPVILLIDEVDKAGNYKVFLDFLSMLRKKYLDRDRFPSFQSVILAGVYDIKNLKLKMRNDNERQYNSPWNIAADFRVDMSFSAAEIAIMLGDYEREFQTGMAINEIAYLIYEYTLGYPFLVSRICKIIDEEISKAEQFHDKSAAWSFEGFHEAIRILLNEQNLLFDDMIKKLSEYPELYKMLHNILFYDQKYTFDINSFVINLGFMFGFIRQDGGRNAVAVANRIFEMKLNLFFLSEAEFKNRDELADIKNLNQFTKDGHLNMDLVMEKFAEYYAEIYRENDRVFLEKNGCKIFLMHLKQIINGTGNYYREAQTFDNTRMDIVVDYLGKQYIIELKIWRGGSYHEEGESQLCHYLDRHNLEKGYMIVFNFNKNKKTGMKSVERNGKIIVETIL
ncbi:MAG: AAA-like domain-containing protein [Lachnospiraceae bacterium]|nr:AAA-like domain-containing protein [Lachnospiraceae bacterium]